MGIVVEITERVKCVKNAKSRETSLDPRVKIKCFDMGEFKDVSKLNINPKMINFISKIYWNGVNVPTSDNNEIYVKNNELLKNLARIAELQRFIDIFGITDINKAFEYGFRLDAVIAYYDCKLESLGKLPKLLKYLKSQEDDKESLKI